MAADGEASEERADVAKLGDSDEPQGKQQPPVGGDGIAGERDDDPHHVLQKYADVNDAEDCGGEGFDAIFRGAFAEQADGEDHGGKGEQDVGGPPDDRLDPGRERDEHAKT